MEQKVFFIFQVIAWKEANAEAEAEEDSSCQAAKNNFWKWNFAALASTNVAAFTSTATAASTATSSSAATVSAAAFV